MTADKSKFCCCDWTF